jgi:hypothetical protein
MSLRHRKIIPGRVDINRAFSCENLPRMKSLYDAEVKGDGYQFGELIAKFYELTGPGFDAWNSEIAGFYPPDIQNEIMRTVVAALTHKDNKGNDHPIPIRFDWVSEPCGGTGEGVRVTYNSVSPHYHIEIIGYPSPFGSALARRGKGDPADDEIEC